MNARNHHGDTALTISAQHGHTDSLSILLDHKAKPNIRNYAGHTALELSQLYQRKECYDLLKDVTVVKDIVNFFDDNPLNRSASKRSNTTWLASAIGSPLTTYILFHKSKPIVSHKNKQLSTLKLNIELVHTYIEPGLMNVIFLGVYESKDKPEGSAWFAVDIKDMKTLSEQFKEDKLDTLPMYPGALQLEIEDAAIYGQARSLLDWHHR